MSLDRSQADAMVERLRTLAQPQRLMILSVLLDGERAVGEIEEATGIGQPALSQQLAELRRAALVVTRREARQIHYRIADDAAEERVRTLFAAFSAVHPIRHVRDRIDRGSSKVAGLSGAAMFARIG
ncbi:transcriptional regulator [Sphingomonas sp. MA1305]|jgi:DNA-binding transcriptional ArsR family regulator|uniref:ArsR/SmtB family transcription factor n=1 Tax=Sphingomonas TaxID=13687 RepID=UPI0018E00409|nr:MULTISPECIES: metalloregulator ArsR/SmtB family transcription factor [Sphingomonas]MBI0477363.1 transcriptional regulator [Sphingomonas sp. MA1305]